jgi:hypothetical protein
MAVALAPLLEVRGGERVTLRGLPMAQLPPLCGSQIWLGMSCPGCGLTRSWVLLAHGDWAASVQQHRLGWLLMGLALLQIPYRLHALCTGRPLLPEWFASAVGIFLLVALGINWIVGLLLQPSM